MNKAISLAELRIKSRGIPSNTNQRFPTSIRISLDQIDPSHKLNEPAYLSKHTRRKPEEQ